MTANEIVKRAILYAIRTQNAYLNFSNTRMQGYTPPKTRKKPTDTTTDYETDYNLQDGIPHTEMTNTHFKTTSI